MASRYQPIAPKYASITSFTEEDPALQEAIEESLKVKTSAVEAQFGDEASNSAKEADQPPKQRVSIEDRIKDMALRAAVELPVVRDPQADTWVFIDPPQKQPEQDQQDYEHYIKRYEAPIAMRKDTLVKYSQVIEKMFHPTAQHKITRRRNVVKQLRNFPNIKYVIDLTPPTEGEEAVYLTTELCCSEGVRLWYQAREIWKVSKILVGGEEEYTSIKAKAVGAYVMSKTMREWLADLRVKDVGTPRPVSPSGGEAGHTENVAEADSTSPESLQTPSSPKATLITLEYTPVRHRSAIERVLSALQGLDPKLDSAPKVWTTFAVAKYFDIKHSQLDDYIIRWLRAYPNSYFLEVLPEVSLQIADGLENYDLARDTFAILVGEEALDNLRRARMLTSSSSRSAYGRKKEDLPEAIFTRVEYASKAFLERITNDFADFIGHGMQWIETLPEFQKLSSYAKPEAQGIIGALKVLLKDYVRGTICKLLCVNYDSVPAADLQHPGGTDLLPRVSRSEIWNDLRMNERILSRTFWHALTSFKLFNGRTNLDIKEGWNMIWNSINLSTIEQRELHQGTYREILRSSLDCLTRDLSYCLSHHGPDNVSTLPIRTTSRALIASLDYLNTSTAPWGPVESYYSGPILPTDPRVHDLYNSGFNKLPTPGHGDQVAGQDWPFGHPRQDPTQHVLNNSYDVEKVSPSNTVSAAGNEQTDRIISPPEGTSPRFTSSDWDEDNGAEEICYIPQEVLEDRQTPPFFRSQTPPSHPAQPYRPILSSQNGRTQFPSQSSRQAPLIFFDLEVFFMEAHSYIEKFARQKLQSSDTYLREEPLEVGITNTLVCLADSEWKYLPLWAGGNDDGSGGVYIDQPDTADLGFSSPGPDIHTGTPATSIKSPSELDFKNFDIVSDHSSATSTLNTSMVNNRGFSDHMRRNRVYAADSADTSSHQSSAFTDDFTMVTDADEEELARGQIEIQEQLEAAEAEAAAEARSVEKGKDRMLDENYADLFDEMEDDDGDDTDRAEDGDFEDEDEDTVMV